MGMGLTPVQMEHLCNLADKAGVGEAIRECEQLVQDNLALMLLERGGFGTLQLNERGQVPRMRFVPPDQVRPVFATIAAASEQQAGTAIFIRNQSPSASNNG